jgi:hypothetical protein
MELEEKQPTSPMLPYERAQLVKSNLSKRARQIVWGTSLGLFFLGAGSAKILDNSDIGKWILGLAIAVLLVGSMVVGLVEMIFRPRPTEEAEEAAWEDYEEKKDELLAVAKHDYAEGPVGSWREFRTEQVYRERRNVLEDRIVVFEKGGKGRFVWLRAMAHPAEVEAEFDYRPNGEGSLLVRVVSPEMQEWGTVEFGFEARRDVDGEPNLWLWFEGTNKMPLDFKEYWPFSGEFRRVTV